MLLNAKVLIVDDSQVAQMLIGGMVEDLHSSWQIQEAATGREALELAKNGDFDLITIDYNMPDLNGLELAAMIREVKPHLSLILITANVQPAMREKAHRLQIPFLSKPVDKEKIKGLLQELKML